MGVGEGLGEEIVTPRPSSAHGTAARFDVTQDPNHSDVWDPRPTRSGSSGVDVPSSLLVSHLLRVSLKDPSDPW